jgi:hypothetical protein
LTFAEASTRSSGRRSEVIHADDLACSGEQIASCAPLTLNEDVDLIAVHPLADPHVPDPAHNLLLGRSQNIGFISDHREPRFLDPSPLIGFSHVRRRMSMVQDPIRTLATAGQFDGC